MTDFEERYKELRRAGYHHSAVRLMLWQEFPGIGYPAFAHRFERCLIGEADRIISGEK